MPSFLDCVIDQLKAQGFGQKRIDELVDRFNGLTEFHRAEGHPLPEAKAASRMFNEVSFETAENKRRRFSDLTKYAEWGDRLKQFKGKRGASDLGKAVRGGVSFDPRAGALSVDHHKQSLRSQLYGLIGEKIVDISKGVFGRQRGKAHLPNILRELDGKRTGDTSASELAAGWQRMTEMVPKLWRQAGGTMNEVSGIYLPDTHTAPRLHKHGQDKWVADMMDHVDWTRTTWPNGKPIVPSKREEFLKAAWQTKRSNGMNKADRQGLGAGRGGFGNLLDQHRLIHYKTAESWGAMHAKYGDGNLFEAMVNYVDDVSHQMAMIRVWGSNPQGMYDSVKRRALGMAADAGGTHQESVASTLRTVDPMFDVDVRKNPMDPESYLGNGLAATADVLTSAYLGSATLLAVPGDFVRR